MFSRQIKLFTKEQTLRSTTWGHHFIFLNTLLAIVVGFTYVYAAPQTESFVSFLYLIASWFGQISFLGFLAFLIIFFPLSFIGSFKIYKYVSMVLAFLVHCILLIDAKIFLTLKVHLTWSVVSLMFRDLNFKTGLNFNFMYIAMILLVVIEIVFSKIATREIYRKEVRNNYFPRIVMAFVGVCFITSHCLYIWADAGNYEKITNLRTVFPAHYPMTAKSFLSNHGWIDGISSKVDGASTSNLNYPLSDITVEVPKESKSVISIYLNGISYADLNSEQTPNLMKYKINNSSFENHYLPYERLDDNLFAAWFGLPIQYSKPFYSHHIENVLIGEFQKQEYLLRAFISDGANPDFDKYSSMSGIRSDKVKQYKSDESMFAGALSFIKENSSANLSISLCANALVTGSGNENSFNRRLLKLDTMLGEFISELEDLGITDHTMIIITSAQGNSAYNTGVFSRKEHRVPMIVISPDEDMKGISNKFISSHFDITPTVGVEILGIKTPCVNYGIGDDLFTLSQRDYIPTTKGNNLLLISQDNISVYKRNGKVVADDEGDLKPVKPNLENLIRAMRDLNRFKK